MGIETVEELQLPVLPPRGWKKKVAEIVGCSQKTVYNAMRGNLKGPKSGRVLDTYKKMFGVIVKKEIIEE